MLAVLLAACWTGSSPPPPTEPALPSAFEITLTRTACLGSCPVYRVSIDGDGRVRWIGREHVEATGLRRATVPPRRVRALERKLEEVRFFERDARGELPAAPTCTGDRTARACSFPDATICSDTSAAILTVRRGDRQHTVTNDHCTPSPLDEVEALVDDIARTTAWIGERVLVSPASRAPR